MNNELAPGFLVASPKMKDPYFAESLVLLVEAGADGAMGFIVNRKLDVTLSDVELDLDMILRGERRDQPVYFGGPVQPERGWLLVDQRDSPAEGLDVSVSLQESIDVVASLDSLKELLTDDALRPVKLVLGYAGWAQEQLEEEIREGAWIPLAYDPTLVFDKGERDAWTSALEDLGLDPATYWGGGASA